MINGMANDLSCTLNNPKVCLHAPMVPMAPAFSQSSTSEHLARIGSVDNGPEVHLMEDSGNNSAWQPLIYGTFTNSEETPQQSLNSGHLLIPMPKLNDTQPLQNEILQMASPPSSEIFSNSLAQSDTTTRQIEPWPTPPETPNSSLGKHGGHPFALPVRREKASPTHSNNTPASELSTAAPRIKCDMCWRSYSRRQDMLRHRRTRKFGFMLQLFFISNTSRCVKFKISVLKIL